MVQELPQPTGEPVAFSLWPNGGGLPETNLEPRQLARKPARKLPTGGGELYRTTVGAQPANWASGLAALPSGHVMVPAWPPPVHKLASAGATHAKWEATQAKLAQHQCKARLEVQARARAKQDAASFAAAAEARARAKQDAASDQASARHAASLAELRRDTAAILRGPMRIASAAVSAALRGRPASVQPSAAAGDGEPLEPIRAVDTAPAHDAERHAAVRRVFDAYDRDQSGALGRDELHAGLWTLGGSDDPIAVLAYGRLLEAKFAGADLDGDGKLDFEQFLSLHEDCIHEGLTPGEAVGDAPVAGGSDGEAAALPAAASPRVSGRAENRAASAPSFRGAAPPTEAEQALGARVREMLRAERRQPLRAAPTPIPTPALSRQVGGCRRGVNLLPWQR